jgi:dimethylsulfone monooxygenase
MEMRRPNNAMFNANKLKLGIFSPNCSGGMAVTRVPERWDASWEHNRALAVMADAAGIEFLLPIARWIGYGGETEFQNNTLETITWATGLLASTQRISVFATAHTAFSHPIVAAKQFATMDQIGSGRFGLNVVCGWNKPEYDMFGIPLPTEHTARYGFGQEWYDVVRKIWSSDAPFDWDGKYFHLKHVFGDPKPVGGVLPPVMNAGSSAEGRDFAARNADFLFTVLIDPEQGRTHFLATPAKLALPRGCRRLGPKSVQYQFHVPARNASPATPSARLYARSGRSGQYEPRRAARS